MRYRRFVLSVARSSDDLLQRPCKFAHGRDARGVKTRTKPRRRVAARRDASCRPLQRAFGFCSPTDVITAAGHVCTDDRSRVPSSSRWTFSGRAPPVARLARHHELKKRETKRKAVGGEKKQKRERAEKETRAARSRGKPQRASGPPSEADRSCANGFR